MKKLLYIAFSLLMVFGSVSVMAKGDKAVSLTEKQQMRLTEITNRVEEIKEMDKSALSRTEKKELKSELTEMKKEAKALSGGVYLSVTAIIIVLLVLILIL
jgi:hypothetical protein